MYKPSKYPTKALVFIAIVSIALYYWVESSRVFQKKKYYKEKIQAARITKRAFSTIEKYKRKNGLMDSTLTSELSLIGKQITAITTDRGDIETKILSYNPNFAAAFVQMLKDKGLKQGDYIGLSLTGSHPALNIALLAAVQTLKLRHILISSVGSSMWGANQPEFTWLDMEALLRKENIIDIKSTAASYGGDNDCASELTEEGKNLLQQAIERNNITVINTGTLEGNIQKRAEIYFGKTQKDSVSEKHDAKKMKLFVNIGGGVASVGIISQQFLTNENVIARMDTISIFAKLKQENTPIINIDNVREFAKKYGINLVPKNIDIAVNSPVYVTEVYKKYPIIISLFIIISLLVLIIVLEKHLHKLPENGFDPKELDT